LVSKSLRALDIEVNEANPALSLLKIPERTRLEIDVLKHMTFELHIKSPRLRLLERRGSQVVEELFECFKSDADGSLLPIDWRKRLQLTKSCAEPEKMRMRLICDYIGGMTDAYALDMYARLKSANPSILFRPT
jgi:dGTPase